MSRSTQYIGLTKKAEEMSDRWKRVKNSTNWAGGMFGEEVPLNEWHREDGSLVREIVQASPWSSGPMIFTCLAVFKTRASGERNEGGMYIDVDYSKPLDTSDGEIIDGSKWVDIWPAPKDEEFDWSPEYDTEKGEFYFGFSSEDEGD